MRELTDQTTGENTLGAEFRLGDVCVRDKELFIDESNWMGSCSPRLTALLWAMVFHMCLHFLALLGYIFLWKVLELFIQPLSDYSVRDLLWQQVNGFEGQGELLFSWRGGPWKCSI